MRHETKEDVSKGEPEAVQANGDQDESSQHASFTAARWLAVLVACTRPLTGYRTPAGKITLKMRDGFQDQKVQVACSRCTDCRLDRAREWATRLMHESRMHSRTSFVTLTYAEENLPDGNSLELAHWQLFADRMRKRCGKFRYYQVGEYGDVLGRPHHHACLFGLDFSEDRKKHKRTRRGDWLYVSPLLDELWQHGNTYIGELTYQSAAYVARYIMKKQFGDQAEERYLRFDPKALAWNRIKPEFATMSRRPGIGRGWYDAFAATDVLPHDRVIANGREAPVPKYYDRILEQDDPDLLARRKKERRESARPWLKHKTPERLQARARVTEAKTRVLRREFE